MEPNRRFLDPTRSKEALPQFNKPYNRQADFLKPKASAYTDKKPTRLQQNVDKPLEMKSQYRSHDFTEALKASWQTSKKTSEGGWGETIFTYLIVLVICALIYMPVNHYIRSYWKGTVFCNPGQTPSPGKPCLDCPTNGVCKDGELKCLTYYVRSGNSCVKDQTIENDTSHLAELLRSKLDKRSAEMYLATREEYQWPSFMAYSELKQDFRGKEGYFNEVFQRLNARLGEFNIEEVTCRDNREKSCLRLKQLKLGVLDRVRVFWQDYFYVIVACAIAGAAATWKLYGLIQLLATRRKAAGLFQKIKEQLRENANTNYDHGILEDDLRNTVAELAGPSFWSYVEQVRRNDSAVCKFEGLSSGRPAVFWQWKGRAPSNLGDKLKLF